ncbi:MAG: lamin tail domain-containing protein [Patescibacteria group bacterium]
MAFIFFVPVTFFTTVSAAVVIDEIMYDLDGSDTDREWVEILNDGNGAIDLTGFKFDDGATSKHGLNAPPKNGGQGSLVIPGGSYAIFADNAAVFLSEHPGYTGTVIDTLVDLANTSDTVSLIDSNDNVLETVTYDSTWGAKDDGNSLQKINGLWKSALPTPGTVSVSPFAPTTDPSPQETPPANTSSTTSTSSSSTGSSSSFPVEPQIIASAGEKKRIATVGGNIIFSGKVWGLKKEPIENARILWNFGDGSTAEGKTVSHTYRYPGIYIVTLNASSGQYSASDRVTVEAIPANIIISSVGDSQSLLVELHNQSHYELDLSFWSIHAPDVTFIIPEYTFVGAGAKIKFAGEVTGITSNTLADVLLYYPNGMPASASLAIVSVQEEIVQKSSLASSVRKEETKKEEYILPPKSANMAPNAFGVLGTTSEILAAAETAKGSAFSPWISGLLALIGIPLISLFFLPKKQKTEADEIEII